MHIGAPRVTLENVGTTTRTPPAASKKDGILKLLLVAAIALPAFAFRTASYQGEVVAVLYREPKKDAITIFFWAFVLLFLWIKGRQLDRDRLVRIISDPPIIILSILLIYFSLTRLWVTVPANWGYEMAQYGLLFLVMLVLLAWTTVDPTIPTLVERALIASIGVVAGIGVLQGIWPAVAPPPINPFGEVGNPSLMGYKNPAALSVLAQIFLLAGVAFSSRRGGAVGRVLLAVLLVIEIFYLVDLQSRTVAFSLVIGVAVLWVFLALSRSGSARRLVIGSVAAILMAVAGLALNPAARAKVISVSRLVGHPQTYLDTDRGTYLVNTLNMVRYHPFGVGIGDWQTMYPVYRRVNRETAFDDRFQVRRAHSDHVQMLGEGGWIGLILWWTFLAVLLARAAIATVRRRDHQAAFLTAQVAAVSVAMSTDYFTEIPYNKLQFFLLAFLAVSRSVMPRSDFTGVVPRGPWILVTALVLAASLGGTAMALQTERKLIGSATTTALYLKATQPGIEITVSRALLHNAARIGDSWVPLPGHWKPLFRDHLALARSEAFIGRRRRARDHALESLRLQPFNPQTLRLMADLSDDPIEEARWRAAADHVETSAGSGLGSYRQPGDKSGDMTE